MAPELFTLRARLTHRVLGLSRFLISSIALVTVSVAAPVWASSGAEPRVVSVRHNATVLQDSVSQPIKVNASLEPGDVLETDKFGRVSLILPSRMLLKVSENTWFSYQGVSEKGIEGELKRGKVWLRGQRSGAGVNLKTPTATASIRGTEWYMEVDEAGSTTIGVLDGRVAVSNEYGAVELASREVALIEPGEKPVKMVYLTPDNAVNWTLQYRFLWADSDSQRAPGPLRDAIPDIIKAYQVSDLEQASQRLTDLPASIQGSAQWRGLSGFLYLSTGQHDQAQSLFRSSAAEDPGWGWPYAQLAFMSIIENQLEKAQTLINTGLAAEPGSAALYVVKAYYHKASLELEKAAIAVRNTVELAPSFVPGLFAAAQIAIEMGDLSAAESLLNAVPATEISRSEKELLLGFIALRRSDTARAHEHFLASADADPERADAWMGLGMAKINSGQIEGGLEAMVYATVVAPQVSSYQSYLAKAFFAEGDTFRANIALDRAKRLDPKDPTPWLYEAAIQYAGNQVSGAVNSLKMARDLNDNRAVLRSRYLLDQDEAVLMSNITRAYNDFGLDFTATQLAARAIEEAPLSGGAHRRLRLAIQNDPREFDRLQWSAFTRETLFSPVTISSVMFTEKSLSPYQSIFNRSGSEKYLWVSVDSWRSKDVGDTKWENFLYGDVAFGQKLDIPLAFSLSVIPDTKQSDYIDDERYWNVDSYGNFKWAPSESLGLYGEVGWAHTTDNEEGYSRQKDYPYLTLSTINHHPSDWSAAYGLSFRNYRDVTEQIFVDEPDWAQDLNDDIRLEAAWFRQWGSHQSQIGLRQASSKWHSRATYSEFNWEDDEWEDNEWEDEYWEKDFSDYDDFFSWDDVEQSTLSSLFLSDQFKVSEKWRFTGGLTLDHIAYENSYGADYTKLEVNPALGVSFDVTPSLRIRGAVIENTSGDLNERFTPVMIAGFPWLNPSQNDRYTPKEHEQFNLQRQIWQAGFDYAIPGRNIFLGSEVAAYDLEYSRLEDWPYGSDPTDESTSGNSMTVYAEALLPDDWSLYGNVVFVDESSSDYSDFEGVTSRAGFTHIINRRWWIGLETEYYTIKDEAGTCTRGQETLFELEWLKSLALTVELWLVVEQINSADRECADETFEWDDALRLGMSITYR